MRQVRIKQSGQSMVEYVVILGALTTALLTAGVGNIGFSKADDQSLMQAMHNRYTDQAFALSISELPEGRDLTELASYYNELDKYPELAKQLQASGAMLNKVTSGLSTISSGVSLLEQYTNPQAALNLIDTDAIKQEIKNNLEDAVNPF